MAIAKSINTNGLTIVKNSGGSNYINTVTLAPTLQGDITGGTLTVRAKAEGAANFETLDPGTIDFSAPERLEIRGAVNEYEFTVAGFTGSSPELYISMDSESA
jgi:hypothetical protein